MAKISRKDLPKHISVPQMRYLLKTGSYVKTASGYAPRTATETRPSYGRGSRGASEWNYQQRATSILADEYNLTSAERRSNQGYLRRIRNVIKMAKTDPKIQEIMNRRLGAATELHEELGYKDITKLGSKDIEVIMEAAVSRGGLINIPSFANPKKSDGEYAWDS